MKKKTKKFDCVAFKNKVQAKIFKDIKDMSNAEQILYFKKKVELGPLGEWWEDLKEPSHKERALQYQHGNH